MQTSFSLNRRSVLDAPIFFPAVVAILVIGNVCDLVGTYIAQPHFENEANPVYNFLLSHGYYLGWPGAIFGKIFVCLLFAWGLRLFLVHRRQYYPLFNVPKGRFLSTYLYGRPLNLWQQFYSLPLNYRPPLYFIGAACALGGPYYLYLGYDNLAFGYGWWRSPFLWFGEHSINSAGIVLVIVAVLWLRQQMWNEYQAIETVIENG